MNVLLLFLVIFLLSIVWTIVTARLLRAVLGLAFASAVLSVLMFLLDAPMAGVFELSVCAGLIPVIFFTTISFTQRLTAEEVLVKRKKRLTRFWLLPVIVAVAGIILSRLSVNFDFPLKQTAYEQDVKTVLWNVRHIDILGQIIMILIGSFGVVVLFKEKKK